MTLELWNRSQWCYREINLDSDKIKLSKFKFNKKKNQLIVNFYFIALIELKGLEKKLLSKKNGKWCFIAISGRWLFRSSSYGERSRRNLFEVKLLQSLASAYQPVRVPRKRRRDRGVSFVPRDANRHIFLKYRFLSVTKSPGYLFSRYKVQCYYSLLNIVAHKVVRLRIDLWWTVF